MWGIPDQQADARRGFRFIPTHVGHTGTAVTTHQLRHGSSPHTWSMPVHILARETSTRFIPTYVGHTSSFYGVDLDEDGSSPPTWGIHTQKLVCVMGTRFIPTYVGHTAFHLLHSRWFPVHPHLRGAYGSSGFSAIVVARFIPTYVGHTFHVPVIAGIGRGSSPHTWGILPCVLYPF